METNEFHGSAQESSAPKTNTASRSADTEDQQSHDRDSEGYSRDDRAADEALSAFRRAHFRCHNVDRSLRFLRGKRMADGKKIPIGARLAFCMVLNFECAYFGVPYLAELLEVAESTARYWLACLESAKVVYRHPNRNVVGGCSTNTYEAIFDPAEFDRRGGTATDRWHKPSVPKPRIETSDGEGALWKNQGGIEPVPELVLEAPPSLSAASFESNPFGESAEKVAEISEVREPDRAAPPARPHGETTRLPLRGESNHPLLDELSNAALLSLPCGRGALKKLTAFGLTEEQAKRAVAKLLQYDKVHGVKNAAGLLHRIIEDLRSEDWDREERRQESLMNQGPDLPKLDDRDIRQLKGNVRKRSPEATEAFLRTQYARDPQRLKDQGFEEAFERFERERVENERKARENYEHYREIRERRAAS